MLGAASYRVYRLADAVRYADGLEECEETVACALFLSTDPFATDHYAVYEVRAVSSTGVMTRLTCCGKAFRFPTDAGSSWNMNSRSATVVRRRSSHDAGAPTGCRLRGARGRWPRSR